MVLTQKQITEGNDKLAKLLGWYQEDNGADFHNVWYEKGDSAIYVAFQNDYPHRTLPFHRDWNYLMKVVDKIGYLVYHRDDDAPDYNWKLDYSYSELFHHMWNKWLRVEQAKKGEFNLMNDLTTIWSGCVAWVDWYYSEENQKDE